jgi:amino acid transporter
MNRKGDNKINWMQKFYQWLSYAVILTIIVIGAGILTKIFLPDPYPLTILPRWALGGIILGYGIARGIMIYLKGRKTRHSDATFGDI